LGAESRRKMALLWSTLPTVRCVLTIRLTAPPADARTSQCDRRGVAGEHRIGNAAGLGVRKAARGSGKRWVRASAVGWGERREGPVSQHLVACHAALAALRRRRSVLQRRASGHGAWNGRRENVWAPLPRSAQLEAVSVRYRAAWDTVRDMGPVQSMAQRGTCRAGRACGA
jgi:hypothetical protein